LQEQLAKAGFVARVEFFPNAVAAEENSAIVPAGKGNSEIAEKNLLKLWREMNADGIRSQARIGESALDERSRRSCASRLGTSQVETLLSSRGWHRGRDS
jgi:hypothetical protein